MKRVRMTRQHPWRREHLPAIGANRPVTVSDILGALAGRDLACWCPLDDACHADVLLEVANNPPQPAAAS